MRQATSANASELSRLMMLICRSLLLAAAVATWNCDASNSTTAKLYPLAEKETVFAYSRISPNGRFLAYTSEPNGNTKPEIIERVVRVVDLASNDIVFSEPGIDPYWSPDGSNLIYVSNIGSKNLAIWNMSSRAVIRDVAPRALGDYPSWGRINGRNVIVTVGGNYYFLNDGKAEMPFHELSSCPGLGAGGRPLISKANGQITVFVGGAIVVRNLIDCNDVFVTNVGGAKADFSYDGRYIAFHVPKSTGEGYEVHVIDLQEHDDIRVTNLPGSSLYPSWTADAELVFRYENGSDRGFVRAAGFMANRRRSLPTHELSAQRLSWETIFPNTKRPASRVVLVVVWAVWGSHSADALLEANKAAATFRAAGADVTIATAAEPTSSFQLVTRLMHSLKVDLQSLNLSMQTLPLTWAHNQIPAVLMFKDDNLVARRLGAQNASQLAAMVADLNR